MKIIEAVFATTHLDSHFERLSKGTLESMARTISEAVVPFGIEHDPRIPPIGRTIAAHVELADDGEYRLVGTIELYEDGDEPEFLAGRNMPHEDWTTDQAKIVFDRNFNNPSDQAVIAEIGQLLGTTPEYSIKKAAEPLSILTIAAFTFALGGIANGFLKQIGADAYDLLKERLKKLMSTPKEGEKERLFVFQTAVREGAHETEVLVIYTNPRPEDIDEFFAFGLQKLDAVLPPYCGDLSLVQRIVLGPEGDGLKVVYAVRRDAVPLTYVEHP